MRVDQGNEKVVRSDGGDRELELLSARINLRAFNFLVRGAVVSLSAWLTLASV